MLQEEVFEHAQLFAQQFDLGLQPLVLLLQLIDALLRVHRLLLAAHAALLHGQVVAFASLAILIAVLFCMGLLHLAGRGGALPPPAEELAGTSWATSWGTWV